LVISLIFGSQKQENAHHMMVVKPANAMLIEFPRLKSVKRVNNTVGAGFTNEMAYKARRLPGISAKPLCKFQISRLNALSGIAGSQTAYIFAAKITAPDATVRLPTLPVFSDIQPMFKGWL
jgi:hypothetical protein